MRAGYVLDATCGPGVSSAATIPHRASLSNCRVINGDVTTCRQPPARLRAVMPRAVTFQLSCVIGVPEMLLGFGGLVGCTQVPGNHGAHQHWEVGSGCSKQRANAGTQARHRHVGYCIRQRQGTWGSGAAAPSRPQG